MPLFIIIMMHHHLLCMKPLAMTADGGTNGVLGVLQDQIVHLVVDDQKLEVLVDRHLA